MIPMVHSLQLLPPSAQIPGQQNTTPANHMFSIPTAMRTSPQTHQSTLDLRWTLMRLQCHRKKTYRWCERRIS